MPDEERIKAIEILMKGICRQCMNLKDDREMCWTCYDSRGDE